ncbi:MAG TPA: PAS domain S-box protein [Candidatus Methylomirabilis sp.]|nr:PAS domain S-box protein [Candidatus Methylomirabilis sp.]
MSARETSDGWIYTGIIRDITKRKQAEEALRESEARFRSVLDNSRDVIYCLNMQTGRYEYISPCAETVVGFSPDELMAMDVETALAMIHPDDLPAMRAVLAHLENTGKGELEYRQRAKNGDYRWISNHMSLIKDSASQPLYRNGNIRDITEHRQAEETLQKAHDKLELRVQERTAQLQEANKALMESEASYRELTESIDDFFYAMDTELRYTYWNKASEAFTGISAKDAVGKSLYELFPDIKGTKAEQFYINALKTRQPEHLESEYKLGEKKFIFEINAYPTKTGLSVIAKDITEKKNLEARLLRAQRMESIGILAGGIAHNLNNMLTPMMLSLQMLKQKLNDKQSQKLLDILENNSRRSADLIKQVLSFSRGIEGERTPLAAKHLILEIEKITKETFPRSIEIRTDIPKDLYTISGDATQLHQVIMNLCVNARDVMPDGGILGITASNHFIDENYARMHTEAKVGSYVIISVSDNGTGVPAEVVDRIFEPFFTTKEFGKGTGLGLSTVLAIVKSHGGFINVESEVGAGTTFRVYLPAIKTEMQNVEEQKLELLTGYGELILVAEDEDSVRDVTVSTLEKYGYNVLAASDGAQAVAEYAENMGTIKVILMDMMMPVMDGFSSIRAIRKINPEVKIIVVSGLSEKEKLKNVADYTNAFLPKPYTAEKLLKTMHEILSAK